jgi:tRNA-uridine 2-sulfurtransferase
VQGHDHPWLLSPQLEAADASWCSGSEPADGLYAAKTRYRQADSQCTLTSPNAAEFALSFDESQWAVTPGQSAVLYDGEVCLGGGVINSAVTLT